MFIYYVDHYNGAAIDWMMDYGHVEFPIVLAIANGYLNLESFDPARQSLIRYVMASFDGLQAAASELKKQENPLKVPPKGRKYIRSDLGMGLRNSSPGFRIFAIHQLILCILCVMYM